MKEYKNKRTKLELNSIYNIMKSNLPYIFIFTFIWLLFESWIAPFFVITIIYLEEFYNKMRVKYFIEKIPQYTATFQIYYRDEAERRGLDVGNWYNFDKTFEFLSRDDKSVYIEEEQIFHKDMSTLALPTYIYEKIYSGSNRGFKSVESFMNLVPLIWKKSCLSHPPRYKETIDLYFLNMDLVLVMNMYLL